MTPPVKFAPTDSALYIGESLLRPGGPNLEVLRGRSAFRLFDLGELSLTICVQQAKKKERLLPSLRPIKSHESFSVKEGQPERLLLIWRCAVSEGC